MPWMVASDENLEHLQHYGTPGMKWGVRNYIDENGTLTAAGRERYRNKSTSYTQSSKLKSQKNYINSLSDRIKSLPKKGSQGEKKQLRAELKNARSAYSANSKAERAEYNANKKQERADMVQERENLKEVNRYTQFNKGMATSIERLNKFTELMGKYNKLKKSQIEAKKTERENKVNSLKAENERVANMDIREATYNDNVSRFQAAMKNYRKKRS